VGAVAELVAEFAPRFRPANDFAGAEAWRLTLAEFCDAIRRLGDIETEVAGGLQGLLTDRDSIRVELWLHAAFTRPSAGLVGPLCELLSVRDGYLQHEWVAETLGEIGDPRAIPALSDACSFDVSGDVFRSLPKRCLQALYEIGTPAALTAIKAQLSSPWPEVRWEAADLLAGDEASAEPDAAADGGRDPGSS
jgi:HEAT repeat protein